MLRKKYFVKYTLTWQYRKCDFNYVVPIPIILIKVSLICAFENLFSDLLLHSNDWEFYESKDRTPTMKTYIYLDLPIFLKFWNLELIRAKQGQFE